MRTGFLDVITPTASRGILPLATPQLAEGMKELGYATGIVGKCVPRSCSARDPHCLTCFVTRRWHVVGFAGFSVLCVCARACVRA